MTCMADRFGAAICFCDLLHISAGIDILQHVTMQMLKRSSTLLPDEEDAKRYLNLNLDLAAPGVFHIDEQQEDGGGVMPSCVIAAGAVSTVAEVSKLVRVRTVVADAARIHSSNSSSSAASGRACVDGGFFVPPRLERRLRSAQRHIRE